MPRSGAILFGDLDGRLDTLRVACRKCDRAGRYGVAGLIARHGPNAKLVDWKAELTADCPRQQAASINIMDLCGAYFPDLTDVF